MPKARLKLPQELENLLASDWERVLNEATLGAEDTTIARLYILKQMPQMTSRSSSIWTARPYPAEWIAS